MRPIRIFTPNIFKSGSEDAKPSPKEKKPKTPIARSPIKKKVVATGEGNLFEWIWNERKHVSFINGEPLGNEACSFMFMHVLSKAQNKYPLFKLYPKNIVLGTWEQHDMWDKGLRSDLKDLPEWKKMFDLESELKKEYSKLKKKK